MEKITVGSCFSGIGGIELGLEWTGRFETKWQIENDPYASAVLAKRWPDVKRYGDIRSVDPAGLEPVDLICGGYPCQPFSLAGKRGGSEDERHLWPEMLRIIRGVRPRILLLENVPGHLSLGFERVLGDLAESGFDAEWDCLPACSVGAPHRRDRVFVVAYAQRPERRPGCAEECGLEREGCVQAGRQEGSGRLGVSGSNVADATIFAKRKPSDKADAIAANRQARKEPGGRSWWAVEPDVGRVAHGIPSRVDRLKCLGNAVVPQVAQKIGEMILKFVEEI